MIGSLRGTVVGIVRGSIVLEVAGVGYRVSLIASSLAKAKEGDEMFVWTHLAVRETAQDLYGFETKDELTWFELLLTVSGIGPKSALAVMNAADVQSLETTIGRGDAAALSKTFGIGRKTADKIVLELRDKVGALDPREARPSGSDGDVVDALVGLGYSVKEAREAVQSLPRNDQSTEDRIREAIRIASRSM